MANILVTGGTGFIGVPLVKKLQSLGHNLKLLVRESSDIIPFEGLNNIDYIIGDVRDNEILYKAAENIDLIYHLAAYTRMWAKDKSVIEDTNVKGTKNIAQIALEKNIRFIYISSFIALGGTPIDPVDETYESEEGLYLDYAKTKFQAKKLIKDFINKDLNATIFYPGIAYGPGDFNIFGQTILDITARKFLGCPGKGDNIGSFVYVNDIVDGVVSVIDRNDLKGEDFILGGINIKFGDWMDLIAEIAGNKKKPRHFPMSFAKLYALLCELKTKLTNKMPYTNRSTVKMINHNWSYSSEKAIEKLGYKITPLREGLEETIKWYKDYIEKEKN
ncbi:MAG: NAD-dependent epimerase/dehydratase family protein [Promethearchaeota archaeon]|nr:MAG: NAD-dependent epimerase/dehydratase family protein [Candidatus Lokiarchaeota archaeon]